MTDKATLLDFPCDYTFKAFCDSVAQDGFEQQVLRAVNNVLPCSAEALRARQSSGGRFCCVSVLVRLHNREQLDLVYRQLQQVDGLVYLL